MGASRSIFLSPASHNVNILWGGTLPYGVKTHRKYFTKLDLFTIENLTEWNPMDPSSMQLPISVLFNESW